MTRLTDTLLQNNAAYIAGKQAPVVDLRNGGQMGYSPVYAEWVSNAKYIRKNLICILVEAPTGFEYLDPSGTMTSTLKALVELHAMSVEGLNAKLTVETAENPFGGGGQVQEDPTDVKEERPNISFKFEEKYGMPIFNFFRYWITGLIMDPQTKVATIATLPNRPADLLPDRYTATMLFIEPDPVHNKVVKSWLVTNMMPKDTGDAIGRRELTAAGEQTTYDIQFTGIAQYSTGVDSFAQRILDSLSITGANPQRRAAFLDGISADVAAGIKGYQSEAANIASSQV